MDYDQQTRAPRIDDLLVLWQQIMALGSDHISPAALEEMASVTVENSDHARMLIKTTHDFIRDPAQVAALDAETAKHLPLDRIADPDGSRDHQGLLSPAGEDRCRRLAD